MDPLSFHATFLEEHAPVTSLVDAQSPEWLLWVFQQPVGHLVKLFTSVYSGHRPAVPDIFVTCSSSIHVSLNQERPDPALEGFCVLQLGITFFFVVD